MAIGSHGTGRGGTVGAGRHGRRPSVDRCGGGRHAVAHGLAAGGHQGAQAQRGQDGRHAAQDSGRDGSDWSAGGADRRGSQQEEDEEALEAASNQGQSLVSAEYLGISQVD